MTENERNFIAFVIASVCPMESKSRRLYSNQIDVVCMFPYLKF